MKADRISGKMWRAVRQSVVIVVLAVAAGLLTNQARSNSLPLVADWSTEVRLTTDTGNGMVVSLDEAKALWLDKQVVFLDARSQQDFAQGHIQGAWNIPWQSFDEYAGRIFDNLPENANVVTYCDGEHCSLGEDLAKELLSMGYPNVKVLLNGWTRWQEAGLPGEKGEDAYQG